MKPKYLNDKDPWLLAEIIPDCDLFFSEIWMSSFTNDSSYAFLKKFIKVIAMFEKFNMKFYYGDRDSYDVA